MRASRRRAHPARPFVATVLLLSVLAGLHYLLSSTDVYNLDKPSRILGRDISVTSDESVSILTHVQENEALSFISAMTSEPVLINALSFKHTARTRKPGYSLTSPCIIVAYLTRNPWDS